FFVGTFVGKQQIVCNTCKPEAVNFSLFWSAYETLHQAYIDKEGIDEQKLIYGAIEGMAKSLGDPYTSFFDPKQAKVFEQDLAGSFGGIGIEVASRKGQLIIVAPLKGTPGEKAGLKPGDSIVKIDGKITNDLSTDEAVSLIRGKKGTTVTLTIFREGWQTTKDFSIVRATIKIDSINWELKNGDVAIIYIHQFDQTLSADFKKAAFEILQSPAKKIIVDVRGNPGGYLQTAQDIAGWFLPNGHVVTIEDFGKDKARLEYRAEGNASFLNFPVVVLIDKGSASASEILAGALRDDRGIKLIGEKSFGKGSVQEIRELAGSESFLKITIARWLTPKGSSISEVGLTPDVVVAGTLETKPDSDPQLDKALEIIKGLK
ncbi:MAG: S41 family peptidase, partial [Candidatus Staskawiczbacteria bacterium]|nr:S41 family peptidase [Candidatus Staskawiczbacteria bacterium]